MIRALQPAPRTAARYSPRTLAGPVESEEGVAQRVAKAHDGRCHELAPCTCRVTVTPKGSGGVGCGARRPAPGVRRGGGEERVDTIEGTRRVRVVGILAVACLAIASLVAGPDASDARPIAHSGRPMEMAQPQLMADPSAQPTPFLVVAPPGQDAPATITDGGWATAAVPGMTALAGEGGLMALGERMRLLDDLEARAVPLLVRRARLPVAAFGASNPDTVEVVVGARTFVVPSEVDDYPDHASQRYCDPATKPGAVALAEILLEAHPRSVHSGIVRPCEMGETSEHKEGRGFDWGVGSMDVAEVDEALERLLATDRLGNPHALARRIGIMYMIWNGKIWSARLADQGWRTYTGPNSHRDHVHFSLSWAGALGHTTLWQAAAAEGWLQPMPPVDRVLAGLTPWSPSPAATATPTPTPTDPGATPRPTATPAPPTTSPPPPTSKPTTPTTPAPAPTSTPTSSPEPTTSPTPSPSPSPTSSPSPSPDPTTSPSPTTSATPDDPSPSDSPTPEPTPSP